MKPHNPFVMSRYRNMSAGERNLSVAAVLLADAPEDVLPEVLDYRANLVTALRQEALWPMSSRAREGP